MKVIFWNSRGLIATDKQRKLRNIIRDHKCWIIAISETHMELLDPRFTSFIERGRRRGWAISPAIGQSGGLILSWDLGHVVRSSTVIHRSFIGLSMVDTLRGTQMILAAIHLPCDHPGKFETRDAIACWMASTSCNSCLLAGDFNATLWDEERKDCVGDRQDRNDFATWIEHHSLMDLGFSGPIFTWKHGNRRAHLDRFFATAQWIDAYPFYEPSTLHFNGSDHRPIVCAVSQLYKTGKRFHYEFWWEKEEDFRQLISSFWSTAFDSRNGVNNLATKLRAIKRACITWSVTRRGHNRALRAQLEQEI